MNTIDNKSFFQFDKPTLQELVFLPKPNFEKEKESQNIILKSGFSKPENPTKETYTSFVTLTVTNNSDMKITEDIPYLLRVTMGAKFKWQGSLDQDQEAQLLKVNAASLLLSYIRPIVSSVTGDSSFKTEYLPFIDFTSEK